MNIRTGQVLFFCKFEMEASVRLSLTRTEVAIPRFDNFSLPATNGPSSWILTKSRRIKSPRCSLTLTRGLKLIEVAIADVLFYPVIYLARFDSLTPVYRVLQPDLAGKPTTSICLDYSLGSAGEAGQWVLKIPISTSVGFAESNFL